MINSSADKANTTSLAKGAGIMLIGSMIAYALRYVIFIIATRGVGVDAYGIYSLGMSWITIASTIAVLGVDIGVVRYVSIFRGKNDVSRIKGTLFNSLGIVIIAGVVVGILAFLLAPALSQKIYQKPDLTPILQLFAVSVPFFSATMIMLGGTQGFLKMQYTVYISNLFVPLGRVVLSLLFLAVGLNVMGLVWAYVIPVVVGAFGAFFLLNKTFHLFDHTIQAIGVTRELLKFSTPLVVLDVLQLVGGQTELLFLGLFANAADVGIYSAALTMSLIAVVILGAFNSVFSPMVSDLHQRHLMDQLRRLYCLTTKWALTLALPVSLVMFLFPAPLLSISGRGFTDASQVLVILVIGQLVQVAIGSSGTVLMMSGRSKLSLGISLFKLVVSIILDLLLIPKFNLFGAAIASTCVLILTSMLSLLIVYKQLRLHPFEVTMLKPLIAAGLTGIIIYALRPFYSNYLDGFSLLIVGAVVVFLLYGGMVLLFRLEPDDHIVLDIVRQRFGLKKK